MTVPTEMRQIAYVPGGPEGMAMAAGPVPQPAPAKC